MSTLGGLQKLSLLLNLPAMSLASKIILHSPVKDERRLAAFVEQCLADGVSLLAIVGPGCTELEETIDWLVTGDGGNPGRFLCTTSHPDEPFDDVLNMAHTWELERGNLVQEVRL
ncbi:hypothetical protein SAMN03159338_0862 [Sphingomonas sp. NFR04]|nr:hypothetical protein SAMN03159338_0862 [Sphingomonas sp. NFR04]